MLKIETIRHSLAHLLAYAIQELYPGTKFGIGPTTKEGFYYDFKFKDDSKRITQEDLIKIEEKMKELIKQNISFKKKIIPKKKAKEIFKDQPYKLELIEEVSEKTVSIYESGNFINLCKGPHIKSSSQLYLGKTKEVIKAFRLTKIAGAYWKGDEKNPMLTRIYGIAFFIKKELDDYLKIIKEIEKRDHRLLGQKMELFLIDEEIGAGLPIWLPKGILLRKNIENYLYKELSSQDYYWTTSPHIANLNLWKISGHWELYRENMYSPLKIDEEEYILKPMNCPFHIKIYQSKIRSYRDLPLRLAELGTVYRYERSGVLHGLTRVRGFTQDDAHVICAPDQLSSEIVKLLKSGLKILKIFGFKEYEIYLSTQPKKYAGNSKEWRKAILSLKSVLEKFKLKYQIDPEGGVFYGPKIDIKIKDSLGRPWQCATIQVDFNLPQRFKMFYIDKNGERQQPIIIHRALLGSLERFIGVLLEHYAGALPLWLAPEQIWIIPVSKKYQKYTKKINNQLRAYNFRTKIKDENETVSKKIYEGEIQKIPYLLVIGNREIKTNSVAVRSRKGNEGLIELNKFIERIKKEEINKKI